MRKRWNVQRFGGPLQVLLVEIQKFVDLAHGHGARVSLDEFDGVAGTDLALFQDAEIKSHSAACQELVLEALYYHLYRQLVAGHARLAALDQGASYAEYVANMDIVFQHAFNGEVLAELANREIIAAQFTRPVGIVLE